MSQRSVDPLAVIRRLVLTISFLAGPLLCPAHAADAVVPGDFSTIQAAIDAVINGTLPDGASIEVQPGIYQEALSISSTGKSFTVRGTAGAPVTIVDAAGKSAAGVNFFRATGRILFSGLTFRNGSRPNTAGGGFVIQESSPSFVDCIFELNTARDGGGGALIRSNATFTGCIIRNNTARRFGGGVFMSQGSRPVFTRCDIVSNASGTGGAGVGNTGAGGGIHSLDSSPSILGSRVNGNSSKFAAGGIFHMGAFDSPFGTARLYVEDSEVNDNISTQFSPAENPSEGGGFHVEDNAVATLIRVGVLRNRANTGGGLNAYRSRYDVFESVIDSNQATNGFGGGIAATSNNPAPSPVRPASVVNLTQTLVRNNTATTAGGGIAATGDNYCGGSTPTPSCTSVKASVSLTNSVLDSNQSPSQGGGLLLNRSNLAVAGSLIIRNSVTGGALPFGGGMLLTTASAATITGTTIARNTAGQYGGGIFMDDSASLQMNGSQLYDNTASVQGGGLFVGPNGSASGSIQDSIIADNTNYQVAEHSCPKTTLLYQNNTITPKVGLSDVYFGGCAPVQTFANIGQLNGAPSGRASGNNSNVPSFARFLAVPSIDAPSTLSWSVARATNVTIAGVVSSSQQSGSTDVSPASSTTFSMTASTASGSVGPLTAAVFVPPSWGSGAFDDVPVPVDYDGDGKDDVAVYRRSTGEWMVLRSSTGTLWLVGWGAPPLGDAPVPADYDGDGHGDIAVYRASTGEWFIHRSSTNTLLHLQWGAQSLGDVPVPADYDGDGKADIAVYRGATGEWFIYRSATGSLMHVSWGAPALGDVPIAADYDGDGKADLGVYRGTTGQWFVLRSSNATLMQLTWGAPSLGDMPTPADFDGDGKVDVAVVRGLTGEWFVNGSTSGFSYLVWGVGDARVPADFDGDGTSQPTIWRGASGSWLSR